jgi:hypothetical protein
VSEIPQPLWPEPDDYGINEYVERREKLARFLHDLVYGEGAWDDNSWGDRSDLHLNYRLDADDIIKANPHLLSLGERERLTDQIWELRYE